jgi:transcription termination/antitermination protein NusG
VTAVYPKRLLLRHSSASREVKLLPWFAVQTRPKAEKTAALQPKVRGYEVFLPVYRSRNEWSDRIAEVDRPLFPGYCFCVLDSDQPFRIVSAPGVVRIVGWGRRPEPIAENDIVAIQTMLRSGLPMGPHKHLTEGETITITKGPLRGVGGLLVRNKNNMKVVVSIELLQRSVAVELDYEAVSEASIN